MAQTTMKAVVTALIEVLLEVAAFFICAVNMRYLTGVRDKRAEIVVEKLVANIKSRLPRIHHVTIELEGIATPPLQNETVPV